MEALLSLYPHLIDALVFSLSFCIPPIVSAKLRQAEWSWTFREQGQHQRQARVDSLTQCRDIKSQLLQTKHSFRLDCFNPEDHRSITEWVLKAGVWQTIKPLCCNAFKTADRPPGCMVRSSTVPYYVHKLFSRTRRTNTLQSQKRGHKFGAAAQIRSEASRYLEVVFLSNNSHKADAVPKSTPEILICPDRSGQFIPKEVFAGMKHIKSEE